MQATKTQPASRHTIAPKYFYENPTTLVCQWDRSDQ